MPCNSGVDIPDVIKRSQNAALWNDPTLDDRLRKHNGKPVMYRMQGCEEVCPRQTSLFISYEEALALFKKLDT